MTKMNMLPAAMLSLMLAAPVYAADTSAETQSKTTVEKDSNGNYHKKATQSAESTDTAGTTTTSKTKVTVDTDADGNTDKKVTTETTNDPKGLMNKTKTTTTDTEKSKDGSVEVKHQKKVNGKTVEETTQESK